MFLQEHEHKKKFYKFVLEHYYMGVQLCSARHLCLS